MGHERVPSAQRGGPGTRRPEVLLRRGVGLPPAPGLVHQQAQMGLSDEAQSGGLPRLPRGRLHDGRAGRPQHLADGDAMPLPAQPVRQEAGRGQLPQLKPGVVPTHLIVVVRGSPWLLYTAYIWADWSYLLQPETQIDWESIRRRRLPGKANRQWAEPPWPRLMDQDFHLAESGQFTGRVADCSGPDYGAQEPLFQKRRRGPGQEHLLQQQLDQAGRHHRHNYHGRVFAHGTTVEKLEWGLLRNWLAIRAWTPLLARPFSREATMITWEWMMALHGRVAGRWAQADDSTSWPPLEQDTVRGQWIKEHRQAYGAMFRALCARRGSSTRGPREEQQVLRELSQWIRQVGCYTRCGRNSCVYDRYKFFCESCKTGEDVSNLGAPSYANDPRKNVPGPPGGPARVDWEDEWAIDQYVRRHYSVGSPLRDRHRRCMEFLRNRQAATRERSSMDEDDAL